MLDQILTAESIASLLTLTALEIILGVDNIIFLAIITGRLPQARQSLARKLGLILALVGRIIFLFSITWIIKAQTPFFAIGTHDVTIRDIILIVGGVFLVYKSLVEIHHSVMGFEEEVKTRKNLSFSSAIGQIAVIDVVFALDSMITAVGLSDFLSIMIAANIIAMIVMICAAEPISKFIEKHPSLKMLALSFLLMVGVALMADGSGFHIPRGYIYFSLAFSIMTEALNILSKKNEEKKRHKK